MELDNGTLKTATTVFNIKIKTNATESTEEDAGYPEFSPDFLKKKYGYKPSGKIVEPLGAQIYDITKSGNLTIVFSKPIILPPIDVFEEYNGNR